MFQILFLLFIVIPIIEIAVIIQVGSILGVWPTVAIVILTAWLGAKNVRAQGIATMQKVQLKMAQGEMPSDDIVAGMLLLVAGVLLVTPGFVTDIFGLSLLIPQVRKNLINGVKKHVFVAQMQRNGFTQFESHNVYTTQEKSKQDRTIDGEFERKE
ncbi:FxsA family protein [Thalassotalea agarivorans]|uniref:UPF0716 protein FxsA n=1 Tax=Thalassotalea agarivorans TaxID=349064 RepID=A0A1I0GLJ7_THASX|nr:FxsA family protein [Thalassotalea agarivorans]SET70952.1 UPF0716 protein FxsA [Thalassotalea agarivorans]